MSSIRRVAILFSGGPAPAANAVITSAAMTFRRNGVEVLGILHGYSGLVSDAPLVEGEVFLQISDQHLRGLRTSAGVFLGTARANPGKRVQHRDDLADADKTAPVRHVLARLRELEVDALISIGGEDTLRTANILHRVQDGLPAAERIRVVHLPKTIDNDYRGIDFTFGFFTAVEVLAQQLRTLRADALATRRYFVVQTMGRKAAWLAYGVAIAGEAHMVVGIEDVVGALATDEDGRACLDLDALCDRIVDLVHKRAEGGKHYGTIVIAEGLAEMLPQQFLDGLPRDPHGHLSISSLDMARLVASRAEQRIAERLGREVKLTGVQLGYEARCAVPHAFDVVLGCQLGLGAWRALGERGLDGHMVSVAGQMELEFVPFSELVDPDTLKAEVRFVEPGSDFHRLAHELGTRID